MKPPIMHHSALPTALMECNNFLYWERYAIKTVITEEVVTVSVVKFISLTQTETLSRHVFKL